MLRVLCSWGRIQWYALGLGRGMCEQCMGLNLSSEQPVAHIPVSRSVELSKASSAISLNMSVSSPTSKVLARYPISTFTQR